LENREEKLLHELLLRQQERTLSLKDSPGEGEASEDLQQDLKGGN
jgi:hypothetical protein